MAGFPRVIDVEDAPDLLRLVEEVRVTHDELVIRQNGENVAVLVPAKPDLRGRPITEEDIESARSAAGSWEGHIDDKVLDEIYGNRRAWRSPANDHGPGRIKTPDDYEAFRRSAGSWKEIDAVEFIRQIYERRLSGSKPPVEL